MLLCKIRFLKNTRTDNDIAAISWVIASASVNRDHSIRYDILTHISWKQLQGYLYLFDLTLGHDKHKLFFEAFPSLMSVGLLEAVFFPLCSSSLTDLLQFGFNYSNKPKEQFHIFTSINFLSFFVSTYQGWFKEIHFGLYPRRILESAAGVGSSWFTSLVLSGSSLVMMVLLRASLAH